MLDRSGPIEGTPNPAPNAPEGSTPPNQPAPSPNPPTTKPDPILARLNADLGAVIDKDGSVKFVEPTRAPDTIREGMSPDLMTLGEAARFKAERKELADAEAKAKEAEAAKKAEGTPPTPAPSSTSAAAPVPAAAPTQPAPTPPKKPVAVEVAEPLDKVVAKAVDKRLAEAAKPTEVPKPSETPADPESAYIASLPEDAQEQIELAARAEKEFPERYKGARAAMIAALHKTDEFIAAKTKADPDWSHDKDPEFDDFIEDVMPKISRKDRRQIESAIIEERAEARVLAKLQPQINEAQRAARSVQVQPAIEKTLESLDALLKASLEADPKAPRDENEEKLVGVLAGDYSKQAKHLAKLYLDISEEIIPYPEYNNNLPFSHPTNKLAMEVQGLQQFLMQQEEGFLRNGGDLRIRDGKKFVPRAIYAKLDDNQRSQVWTLGHGEVLEIIAYSFANQVKNALETEKKRLTEAGYVRQAKTPNPKPEEKNGTHKPREESPRAASPPSPGLAQSSPPLGPPPAMSEAELARLRTPGVSRWN